MSFAGVFFFPLMLSLVYSGTLLSLGIIWGVQGDPTYSNAALPTISEVGGQGTNRLLFIVLFSVSAALLLITTAQFVFVSFDRGEMGSLWFVASFLCAATGAAFMILLTIFDVFDSSLHSVFAFIFFGSALFLAISNIAAMDAFWFQNEMYVQHRMSQVNRDIITDTKRIKLAVILLSVLVIFVYVPLFALCDVDVQPSYCFVTNTLNAGLEWLLASLSATFFWLFLIDFYSMTLLSQVKDINQPIYMS